jgi:hypothetical protein
VKMCGGKAESARELKVMFGPDTCCSALCGRRHARFHLTSSVRAHSDQLTT